MYDNLIHSQSFMNKANNELKLHKKSSNSFSTIDELDQIYKLMLEESEFVDNNSEDLLSLYLRKNINNLTALLIELIEFIKQNALYHNFLIKCLKIIFNLLTENVDIIYFINTIVPILIDVIFKNNITNLNSIKETTNFIGELMKEGGIYSKEMINNVLKNLVYSSWDNTENPIIFKNKILYLYCAILKNISFSDFFKVYLIKENPNNFNKLIILICDEKLEIRLALGETIYQTIKLFSKSDVETKNKNIGLLYSNLYSFFISFLYDNNYNDESKFYFISGFFILIKNIFLAAPSFFNNTFIYKKLIDCFNICHSLYKNNIEIEAECAKFIPELYRMNKKIFLEEYQQYFMEIMDSLLNYKENIEISNQLLLSFINLNICLNHKLLNTSDDPLLKAIKELINRKTINDELLKCLSDLLNNKNYKYFEKILDLIDICSFLSIIFKPPLTLQKVNFILSLLNCSENKKINNSIIIVSLNAISFIIDKQSFQFDNINKDDFLTRNFDNALTIIKEEIINYNNENKYDSSLFNYTETIFNSLTLFSNIHNNLFYKDMMNYYSNKLLPSLLNSDNKIKIKIVDIVLYDFIKIYDDFKISEFTMIKIIQNFVINLDSDDNILTEHILEVFIKKEELLLLAISKENLFLKTLTEMLISQTNYSIKDKIVQIFALLYNKNIDEGLVILSIQRIIINTCLNMTNSRNMILLEDLSNLLLSIVFNFRKKLSSYFLKVIVTSLLYLMLFDNLKGVIRINIFLILNELLYNYDLVEHMEKSILFKSYLNLLFVICIYYLTTYKDIDKYLPQIILKILYRLIIIKNIDIFESYNINEYIKNNVDMNNITENLVHSNMENKLECINRLYLIGKQLKNVRIIELLIPYFRQSEQSNNELHFVIDIFGLYENMSNIKYKIISNLNFISYFFGEVRTNYTTEIKKIIKYDSEKLKYDMISMKTIEPINVKVIMLVSNFLKNNHRCKELSNKIISCLEQLIIKIKPEESNLIDIILPVLLEIIPNYESRCQKLILENIFLIVNNFQIKIKSYVKEIYKILINYPLNENFNIIFKLFSILLTNFIYESESFYPIIIRKFFLSIKNCNNNYRHFFIQLLGLLCKNNTIFILLDGFLNELNDLYLLEDDIQCISDLFALFENIIGLNNSLIFYQIIISSLLKKIINLQFNKRLNTKDNELNYFNFIVNKTLDMFILMKNKCKIFLEQFLFQIISVFIFTGFIKNFLFKEKLKYLISSNKCLTFKNYNNNVILIRSEYRCNCYFGFNRIIIENISKEIKNKNKNFSFIRDEKKQSYNKKDIETSTKTIFSQKKILIETFDNSQCKNKEDWDEWINSTSNILFECSPSYFLKFCHHFSYLNIVTPINKFFDESFLSVYINNDDEVKLKLISSLKLIFENKAIPDSIILKVLGLISFLERNKITIFFQNYSNFSKIAFKYNYLWTAAYYKEKEFLIDSDKNKFENLSSLYYKFGTPETTIGLLKLIKQNFFENMTDYDERDILYFNMQKYDKTLEIINERLSSEKNINIIKELKDKKFNYLYYLCDWEGVLSEDENNDSDNNINSFDEKLTKNPNKIIEREYILTVACANLNQWDKVKIHVNKIHKIIFENLDESKFSNEPINEMEEEKNNQKNDQDLSNNFIKKINIMMCQNSTNQNKNNFSLFKIRQKLFNNSLKNNDLNFLDELIVPYDEIFDKIKHIKWNNDWIICLNLFTIAIKIYEKKYNLARIYINNVKHKLIKTIMAERINDFKNASEFEINDLFNKNYMIHYLELILDYEQSNYIDKNSLKKKIDKIFNVFENSPSAYAKLLSVHSLIFPMKYEIDKYIKLANIYRKNKFFEQEIKFLKMTKQRLRLDSKELISKGSDILDVENIIKLKLCYNKCLFEKGEINDAINNLNNLIEELNINDSKINNILKSKIYSNYAFYKMHCFNKGKEKVSCNQTNNIIIQENSTSKIYKSFSLDKKLNYNFFNINGTKNNFPSSIKILNSNHKETENNIILSLNKETKLIIKNFIFGNNIEEINIINQYYMKSIYSNKDNYKAWENYSLFNYKIYKFIINNEKIFIETLTSHSEFKNNNKEIKYAFNAVNGFKNYLIIVGNDLIRSIPIVINLLDIFYESGSKNKELLSLISLTFNSINSDCFLFVLNQLSYSIVTDNLLLLETLIKLLIKLTIKYPHIMIYYIIEMKLSNSQKIKSIAEQIIYHVMKKEVSFKKIYDDYSFFIPELNKCSLLLHEEFLEIFEITSNLYLKREITKIINQFLQFHQKINQHQQSLYGINFLQSYGAELKTAENLLNKYIENNDENYLNQALEIYHIIYDNIIKSYKNFEKISLKYISPKLFNLRSGNIDVTIPYYNSIFYDRNFKEALDYFYEREKNIQYFKYILIKKIDNNIQILKSIEHLRKIKMIGTNDKEFTYELKVYGDPRQEKEVLQLLVMNNILLARDKNKSNNTIYIPNYIVYTIPEYSSLSMYLENYTSLYQLIKEQRIKSNLIIDIENKKISNIYPNYETGTVLSKVEIYRDILKETSGTELKKIIFEKSLDRKQWFIRRTNYSRTLALSSIVGYIIGLGNRNLKNIYMHNDSCKIMHKNFESCFEFSMHKNKSHEKVPFRLTRILIKALDIAGVEGIFRLTSEKIMELIRKNKYLFLTLLISITFKPFIPWKYIFKQKKIETKKLIENSKNEFTKSFEDEPKIKNKSKIVDKDKQILNVKTSENDLQLNNFKKISKIIMKRMNEKLTGMDFGDIEISVKEQVGKLIKQATSEENIVQNDPTWNPFW